MRLGERARLFPAHSCVDGELGRHAEAVTRVQARVPHDAFANIGSMNCPLNGNPTMKEANVSPPAYLRMSSSLVEEELAAGDVGLRDSPTQSCGLRRRM